MFEVFKDFVFAYFLITSSWLSSTLFFTMKIFPDSGIDEISILQPTQPARFAVGARGFLFSIIRGVKK